MRYILNIHRHRSSIMAINATIIICVMVICGAVPAQHSHRVAAEAGHRWWWWGGDRKLALGSEGVVGSSSVPSVCGIPLQAGDEGCLVLVVWFCPLWPAPLER